MPNEITTTVIDAGGRYGVHPTWAHFGGALSYHLFEPDRAEAARLDRKYRARRDIKIVPMALSDLEEPLNINVLRHHGQSSAYAPNPASTWFALTRKGEGDVVDTYETEATTIDVFCRQQGVSLDFLKCDTEGSEFNILTGGLEQIRNSVLGIRCEVYFDEVFAAVPLFQQIHSLMLENGFYLLNLDYTGRGAHCNGFGDGNRYGILLGTDAVWLRRYDLLMAERERTSERVLKYAAFCLANNASDLAIHVLDTALHQHGVHIADHAGTRLFCHVDVAVQKLFNRLKDHPAQDWVALDSVYRRHFGRKLKRMHEFFESEEVNPS